MMIFTFVRTVHCMFLESWNTTKSLSTIWQLNEGTAKICLKLKSHCGFLSYLQDRTANSANLAVIFSPVLCPVHFIFRFSSVLATKLRKSAVIFRQRQCRWFFRFSSFSPKYENCNEPDTGLPSKSHHGNSISCMFLQLPCQVGMKMLSNIGKTFCCISPL